MKKTLKSIESENVTLRSFFNKHFNTFNQMQKIFFILYRNFEIN